MCTLGTLTWRVVCHLHVGLLRLLTLPQKHICIAFFTYKVLLCLQTADAFNFLGTTNEYDLQHALLRIYNGTAVVVVVVVVVVVGVVVVVVVVVVVYFMISWQD